jgi:hypothetical protein
MHASHPRHSAAFTSGHVAGRCCAAALPQSKISTHASALCLFKHTIKLYFKILLQLHALFRAAVGSDLYWLVVSEAAATALSKMRT